MEWIYLVLAIVTKVVGLIVVGAVGLNLTSKVH